MEDQRGNKPWYLTDRARWLAYIYFTQDETIRVDDVSGLDIGVDLLVRPGDAREGEDWMMGVVTDGAVSLPEAAKKLDSGLWIPRDEVDLPSFSTLPDIPILLAYYAMSDERGYGVILSNGLPPNVILPDESILTSVGENEAAYSFLVQPKMQNYLASLTDRSSSAPASDSDTLSEKKRRKDLRVITSLLSSKKSSDN